MEELGPTCECAETGATPVPPLRSYKEALYRQGRNPDPSVVPGFEERINQVKAQEAAIRVSRAVQRGDVKELVAELGSQKLIAVLHLDEPKYLPVLPCLEEPTVNTAKDITMLRNCTGASEALNTLRTKPAELH